jgi:hypothetical protein
LPLHGPRPKQESRQATIWSETWYLGALCR